MRAAGSSVTFQYSAAIYVSMVAKRVLSLCSIRLCAALFLPGCRTEESAGPRNRFPFLPYDDVLTRSQAELDSSGWHYQIVRKQEE
jgi:hypothetical protein